MNIRTLSAIAAVLLLAACNTPDNPSGGGGGGGGDQGKTATAPQPTPTPEGPTPTAGIQAGSREDFAQNVGDRVFFDYDRSDIKSEGRTTLQRQAAWLKQNSQYTLTIEGHCDERGTREYNLALGQRRAAAVRKALIALGVSSKRISVISYGKERPAVNESNEQAWAQNRRGVTVLN
ncbi:MAG TPA: peptidoglycan-associated lipoprotein Pal [Stellaceae bacterium]|nr:peptidoglycan-associated lipoprotein Pal [Stellaceae bacterium]